MLLRILFCFLFLTSSAYSQDWFDIAEEVFDVDYYEIERVRVLGDNKRGIVLCVWMSEAYNKVVLTKTLKKDIRQTKDNSNDRSYENFNLDYRDKEQETVDDLIEKIGKIINKDQITNGPIMSDEEEELTNIYFELIRLRNINNFEDIFGAIKNGIEFIVSKGVKMLVAETVALSGICQTDSFCIENYNEFINKLKNQYDDIVVN